MAVDPESDVDSDCRSFSDLCTSKLTSSLEFERRFEPVKLLGMDVSVKTLPKRLWLLLFEGQVHSSCRLLHLEHTGKASSHFFLGSQYTNNVKTPFFFTYFRLRHVKHPFCDLDLTPKNFVFLATGSSTWTGKPFSATVLKVSPFMVWNICGEFLQSNPVSLWQYCLWLSHVCKFRPHR